MLKVENSASIIEDAQKVPSAITTGLDVSIRRLTLSGKLRTRRQSLSEFLE